MTESTQKLSFEQALAELENIVGQLEKGEASLDDSIKYYERGMALKKHCEGKLNAAREKIEKISVDKNTGEISTENFAENAE